jgi:hypothetical protein
MKDLQAELSEAVDEAEWQWLAPHARRDSVIVVMPGLGVVDVGVAIANDDTATVQHWISEGLIAKPSSAQLSAWNQDETCRFSALIVQPYVLIQELTSSSSCN